MRYADLIAVVAATGALAALTFVEQLSAAARIGLGLPFVLLFPGYALMAALFPRRSDLDAAARGALSLGLSLAIVPLIGLGLNYSPWGVRLTPLFACVAAFVIVFAVVAAAHRALRPEDRRPAGDLPPVRARLRPRTTLLWGSGLAGALALLAAAGYIAMASGGGDEGFTEFYVLGPAGHAAGFQERLAQREPGWVLVGVTNREGEEARYRIDVSVGGVLSGSRGGLTLADGEEWLGEVAVQPQRAGEDQKLEMLLYRDGDLEPYRRLHLWVTVSRDGGAFVHGDRLGLMRALAAVQTPTPVPATPAPEPTPTPSAPSPTPAPTAHVVSPGEYLTLIAERYGIPLEALLSLNDIPDPDLIYPEQRIDLLDEPR
jgi:uncharacterized membrane protein